MNCFGKKVVSADEIFRVEHLFIQKKSLSEKELLLEAGRKVATQTLSLLKGKEKTPKKISLLVGKGKNGADAYAAGIVLLEKGFLVRAFHLFSFEETKVLCQELCLEFQKRGGIVFFPKSQEEIILEKEDFVIDGIFGIGLKEGVEGLVLEVIKKVNALNLQFVLSIDIPSGVDGNTGKIFSEAIFATHTLSLTLPKTGFFLGQGWNHVGELHLDEIFPKEFEDEVKEDFFLPDFFQMEKFLPRIQRNRHKYQRGYVLGFCGSKEMMGAAKLSSKASLRAGCGIVRVFSLEKPSDFFPECIVEEFEKKRFLEEAKRATACYLGPGIGRSSQTKKKFFDLLASLEKIPKVLDADALFFLAERKNISFEGAILTPHRKEMERLLGNKEFEEKRFLKECQTFCQEKKCILVLKGAPTFLFFPGKIPLVIPRGDPGMATAGSGDVLTGILASFLSQGLSPERAAFLGVFLHSLSGEKAAREKTSHSILASDLIEFLPKAFQEII